MKKYLKNASFYILLFAIMFLIYIFVTQQSTEPKKVFSDVVREIEAGNVTDMVIEQSKVTATLKDSSTMIVAIPSREALFIFSESKLKDLIVAKSINVDTPAPPTAPWWMNMLPYLILILFGVTIWYFFFQQTQGGGGGGGGRVMNFGKSKARVSTEGQKKVNFGDVAGADEEKEDLEEIVEFLRNPDKFTALGARIPKGVLLVGPPGTGKTLLAKAVSGEAGVPFFSISGSDFVEMFVGVGAARVRDLFEQAKKSIPAVIFIDEIDAVGRHRGAGMGGGHDEREQTLNQLLVEMDGFGDNEGVIIIAATNRPDILDPALLRPGRFDRRIVVNVPDVKGREDILKVHSKNKIFDKDVDLQVVAKTTAGFTGADLENLLNEAALLTARKSKKATTNLELQEALMKVMMGAEKRSRVMTDKDKKLTAYHEAGHALITYLMPTQDPIHEVSIIPRGMAGGYTMHLPVEDKFYATKGEMTEQLCVLLGGRAAEKIVIGDISTGASNDIERASDMARKMITRYGMSDDIGPIAFGSSHDEVFIGKDWTQNRNFSEEVASQIDKEIRKLMDSCYARTIKMLEDNRDKLEKIAQALLEFEKLDGDNFKKCLLTQEEIEAQIANEKVDEEKKGHQIQNTGESTQDIVENKEQ